MASSPSGLARSAPLGDESKTESRDNDEPPPKPKEVTPSFFPNYALDQAFCGLGAGVVSTLFMHPLDLVKVKFQVSTTTSLGESLVKAAKGRKPGTLEEIWGSFRDIGSRDGVRGLYRGLTPNLVGNAASWGMYFLW